MRTVPYSPASERHMLEPIRDFEGLTDVMNAPVVRRNQRVHVKGVIVIAGLSRGLRVSSGQPRELQLPSARSRGGGPHSLQFRGA
jgi:hypothetical protein